MSMITPYRFWETLDVVCREIGINLTILCKNTGVNYNTVRNQRSNQIFPKIETLLSFCAFLGASPNVFLTEDPDKSTEPILNALIQRESMKDLLLKLSILSEKQLSTVTTVIESYMPDQPNHQSQVG